jgi:anti-anti-sigma factor
MSATTIDLDRSGSAAILRIGGDVTSASEPDLMAGYAQAAEGGAGVVVLDFAGLEYMNSGGIGLLVTLRRASGVSGHHDDAAIVRSAFSIPGEEGNERLAMDRVAATVADLGLSPARLERLKTAVSEATMNAIEYGSQGRADVPVEIEVEATVENVIVRVTDRALSGVVAPDAETPHIELKLAGDQKPRGWGLFLIRNMVDSMDVTSDGSTQTVTLTMAREERTDG